MKRIVVMRSIGEIENNIYLVLNQIAFFRDYNADGTCSSICDEKDRDRFDAL